MTFSFIDGHAHTQKLKGPGGRRKNIIIISLLSPVVVWCFCSKKKERRCSILLVDREKSHKKEAKWKAQNSKERWRYRDLRADFILQAYTHTWNFLSPAVVKSNKNLACLQNKLSVAKEAGLLPDKKRCKKKGVKKGQKKQKNDEVIVTCVMTSSFRPTDQKKLNSSRACL